MAGGVPRLYKGFDERSWLNGRVFVVAEAHETSMLRVQKSRRYREPDRMGCEFFGDNECEVPCIQLDVSLK